MSTETSIFDDVLAETSGKHEADAPADQPQTSAPTAEAAETNAAEWPKTLTLTPGETPDGAVPVAEFAKIVNERAVKSEVERLLNDGKSPVDAAMEALNVQVSQATFYQAVKAQRNPIPHYIVRYNVPVLDENQQDTGETTVEEKTFVPVEVGYEFWQNRPTRGTGGAARSEEDIEKRLVRAGKKVSDLRAAEKRLAKLTSAIERMKGQTDKYRELLEADGKSLDDAVAAYEATVEQAEGENAEGENE